MIRCMQDFFVILSPINDLYCRPCLHRKRLYRFLIMSLVQWYAPNIPDSELERLPLNTVFRAHKLITSGSGIENRRLS
jgi:hypothetical protein